MHCIRTDACDAPHSAPCILRALQPATSPPQTLRAPRTVPVLQILSPAPHPAGRRPRTRALVSSSLRSLAAGLRRRAERPKRLLRLPDAAARRGARAGESSLSGRERCATCHAKDFAMHAKDALAMHAALAWPATRRAYPVGAVRIPCVPSLRRVRCRALVQCTGRACSITCP